MNFLPKLASSGRLPKKFNRYYQIFPSGAPRRRAAATSLLRKRQTVVIGRTPPGTDVMAPARFAAASIIFYICHDCLPFFDRAYCPVMVT